MALSRNNTYTNPIFPVGGSTFTLSAKFTPPYSLLTGQNFSNMENDPQYQLIDGSPDREKIDQEKRSDDDIAKGIVKFLVDVYDETGETVALATILTMVKKLEDK